MAKVIKKIYLSAESSTEVNEAVLKGTPENPYTQEECMQLFQQGNWQNGFVEGCGYVIEFPEITIWGSAPIGSSCTKVFIESTRFLKGNDCTVSRFTAKAYANDIEIFGREINGFILERGTSSGQFDGCEAAIPAGTYDIGRLYGMTYTWYLLNVPNRTGIAIHTGHYPSNSTGCLLVGSAYAPSTGDINTIFTIDDGGAYQALYNLLNEYGHGGISIKISESFEDNNNIH